MTEPLEQHWDTAEMSPIEHLRELRTRIIRCIIAVTISGLAFLAPAPWMIKTIVAFYFHGIRLHAFSPTDVIGAQIRFAIVAGLFVASPYILAQIWLFVAPAVEPRHRRLMYAYTAPSLILGIAGIAFCHFAVLPRLIGALIAITNEFAEASFGIAATLNLIFMMFLAFIVIFQTPVIVVLLGRLGIVRAAMLRAWRRHILVGSLVVGAFIAPDGAIPTMMLFALTLYALFELSVLLLSPLERIWQNATMRS